MSGTTLLLFILFVQIIHGISTWKLYIKANRKAWEAFVPIYNGIVLMKIINRPTWWVVLLFIPIINLLMFPIIWIETLRTFGKKSTVAMLLGCITLGGYIAYVNYTQEVTYFKDRDTKAPNKTMDTIGSFAFAIIVATFIHTYFIQPYIIPTSSLEKSLLVGDFLFVSKFHYGARTPITPIAAPMLHDTLPIIKTKSYLSKPELPYFRFPGLKKIKRNDIVVFSWPTDTVFKFFDQSGRRAYKPIDKKSNYVKRCVATPGDSLEIKNGFVFINGKQTILPERAKPQYSYKVVLDGKTPINFKYLLKDMNVTEAAYQLSKDTLLFRALTFENAVRLKNVNGITNVIREINTKGSKRVFPHTKNWNEDNYGPIYIPESGKTVNLTTETLPFYKAIITDYEGNTLDVAGNTIKINGKPTTTYTFKQDYYWMMGDNRHNSEDSRYWGYVPENHIVGTPIFIWMSIDNFTSGIKNWKIRWNRVFTTVAGDGERKSYFIYFVFALIAYFIGEYFWKKKQKQ